MIPDHILVFFFYSLPRECDREIPNYLQLWRSSFINRHYGQPIRDKSASAVDQSAAQGRVERAKNTEQKTTWTAGYSRKWRLGTWHKGWLGLCPREERTEGRRQHIKSKESRPSDRRQVQEPRASNWLNSGTWRCSVNVHPGIPLVAADVHT